MGLICYILKAPPIAGDKKDHDSCESWSLSLIKLCFDHTFVFDATDCMLQRVDHMRADVAADENAHDVVADFQNALVQQART